MNKGLTGVYSSETILADQIRANCVFFASAKAEYYIHDG